MEGDNNGLTKQIFDLLTRKARRLLIRKTLKRFNIKRPAYLKASELLDWQKRATKSITDELA